MSEQGGKTNATSIKGLVEGVRKKDSRSQLLLYGYLKKETFPIVQRFVVQNNGSDADAEDRFHDGIQVKYCFKKLKQNNSCCWEVMLPGMANRLAKVTK